MRISASNLSIIKLIREKQLEVRESYHMRNIWETLCLGKRTPIKDPITILKILRVITWKNSKIILLSTVGRKRTKVEI